MKTALFTALALAVATPALASSQLERQLGVEPGVHTTAELVALKLGQDHETGDGARVSIDAVASGDVTISASNASAGPGTFRAIDIANASREPGDGPRIGQVAPTVVDGPSGAALEVYRHFAKSWETGDNNRF